jgi:hypothetical protein
MNVTIVIVVIIVTLLLIQQITFKNVDHEWFGTAMKKIFLSTTLIIMN